MAGAWQEHGRSMAGAFATGTAALTASSCSVDPSEHVRVVKHDAGERRLEDAPCVSVRQPR
jgi:hypothetical protein